MYIYLLPPQHSPDDKWQPRSPRFLWPPLRRCPAFGEQTLSLSTYRKALGYLATVEIERNFNFNSTSCICKFSKVLKCWHLGRKENRRTWRQTLKEENQQHPRSNASFEAFTQDVEQKIIKFK